MYFKQYDCRCKIRAVRGWKRAKRTETQRHLSGLITLWATLPRCGTMRPDNTPPAEQVFDGLETENQKPPQGKSLVRRGFETLSEFFYTERGEGFFLYSADFSTVLALGRARWCLKAKLRHRSGYGASA